MPKKASSAVLLPNLGLYLDRPLLSVPTRGLVDCWNARVRDGTLTNRLLGWTRFGTWTLNGPVRLISNFLKADGTDRLIFGTPTDLYVYEPITQTVSFLTPRYETGTASVPGIGTAVTGVGTTWLSNVKAGDYISFGTAGVTDPAALWYLISAVPGNTSITLAVSHAIVANGPYTIRHTFTGTIQDHWDWDVFINASPDNADLWWGTNGVDPVVKWNPGNTQVTPQPGLGFTCKTLKVFSNMMIYGNLIQGGISRPSSIINSNPGEPANVTTGLASQLIVHGGPEPIIDMEPLADNLVIYSDKRHITMAQFVGAPLIFALRQASQGIGPIGAAMVASFGDYHQFLGADSMYKFDGATLNPIGMQVWKVVLRSRDPRRRDIGFNHFDEENGDLIWALPLVSDPGADTSSNIAPYQAYPEHYMEQVGPQDPTPVTLRYFPFTTSGYYTQQGSGATWATVTGNWSDMVIKWNEQLLFSNFPLSLVGDINGKVYTLNTSQKADGVAMEAFVHFGRRVLGDARMRGMIARVYPFVSSPSAGIFNFDVTLFLSDFASGPATPTSVFPFDITLPAGRHFVSTFRRARFFEAKFGTTTAVDPWTLEGYDVDVKIGGRR